MYVLVSFKSKRSVQVQSLTNFYFGFCLIKQLLEQAESERNKLRELLVRHSELEKVERSIVEVRDMFLRISTLVIEQVRFFNLDLQ